MLFYKLFKHITKCFTGYNLLWQLVMILLTYIIVTSGFDWTYFIASRNSTLQSLLFPAVILGGLLPIVVPLILICFKQKRLLGFALGQAALLGLAISSFYKVFTGRIPPSFNFLTAANTLKTLNTLGQKLTDMSHGFQLGFYRGGVFNGWPSSHATVAFAMALTLIYMYPKSKYPKSHIFVKIFALLYAFYIGFGVSITIHWFSEFVAGAILGSVIGVVVGRGFGEKVYKK